MSRTRALIIAGIGLALPFGISQALAQAPAYKTTELLAICMDADNDSREVGEAARIECEQYVIGFSDGLKTAGALGADKGICLPDTNLAAELRWAFTKWVHENFSERHQPAASGLHKAMKDKFPCK